MALVYVFKHLILKVRLLSVSQGAHKEQNPVYIPYFLKYCFWYERKTCSHRRYLCRKLYSNINK